MQINCGSRPWLRSRSTTTTQQCTRIHSSLTKNETQSQHCTNSAHKRRPADATFYQRQLTTVLCDLLTTTQLESRCKQLEQTVKIGSSSRRPRTATSTHTQQRPISENLTQGIQESRSTICSTPRRKLSKISQKNKLGRLRGPDSMQRSALF